MDGLFAIGLGLVFTFSLLCAWALAKAAALGDEKARHAEEMRESDWRWPPR